VNELRRARLELALAIACASIAIAATGVIGIEGGLFSEERTLAQADLTVVIAPEEGENVAVLDPFVLDRASEIAVVVEGSTPGILTVGAGLVDEESGAVYETVATGAGTERFSAELGRIPEGRYRARVDAAFAPSGGERETLAEVRIGGSRSSVWLPAGVALALFVPVPFAWRRYRRARRAEPPAA
jgi:hypothetical protein